MSVRNAAGRAGIVGIGRGVRAGAAMGKGGAMLVARGVSETAAGKRMER